VAPSAVVLLLAACGSGAFNAPGGEAPDGPSATRPATASENGGVSEEGGGSGDDGGGGDDDGGVSEDRGGPDFSIFALPSGPRTPADVVEDDVYILLQTGSCAEARNTLDAVWQGFRSPRSVFLYEAGVSMCRGDTDGAATWLEGAAAYGWAGMDTEFFVVDGDGQDVGTYRYDCELYRSLVGVLELVSRDSLTCPSGEPPPWPDDFPRQDPRDGPTETTGPDDGEVTDSPTTQDRITDDPSTDTAPTTSAPTQG
jgi:hypothetical protein